MCPLATKVADGSSSASATEEEEREKHEIDVKANATLNYQTSSTWKCAPFHGIHSVIELCAVIQRILLSSVSPPTLALFRADEHDQSEP